MRITPFLIFFAFLWYDRQRFLAMNYSQPASHPQVFHSCGAAFLSFFFREGAKPNLISTERSYDLVATVNQAWVNF